MTFLSGTFYLVERLPEPFRSVSHYNPFFYMIAGFRYGFIGGRRIAASRSAQCSWASSWLCGAGLLAAFRSGWRLKPTRARAARVDSPQRRVENSASSVPAARAAGDVRLWRSPPDRAPKTDHLMGVYNRAPLAFERGEGARL